MPKLWSQTVESHRHAVRDAILDATAGLVEERGLTAVTMSGIATSAGVGRATLYKYFPDVESVLTAWHERMVAHHLLHLAEVRDRAIPERRLEDVLEAYAHMRRRAGSHDPAAFLHESLGASGAHSELAALVADLIAERAASGSVRTDASPDQLADYCLHALSAATGVRSVADVRRLTAIVLDGLRAQTTPAKAAV